MLKAISICLLSVKAIGCALILSGCVFFGSETTYSLVIENNSGAPITYCYSSKAYWCAKELPSGESMIEYYTHVRGGELGALKAFGERSLKICGEMVPIEELKSISPVEHLKGLDYKVIIGKRVSAAYCLAGGE